MVHGYDHTPFFMSCIYIPMSFNNLLQRIGAIYDRLNLPCFNKLSELNEKFGT